MSIMTLWTASDGEQPSRRVTETAVLFSAQGVRPIEQNEKTGSGDALLVAPVQRAADVLGVALVPDGLEEPVRRNGILLGCGLHVLGHADCLELGSARLWMSAAGEVEEATFDPVIHGQDVFCLRTKARLAPGDPIVICPGRPGSKCGAIYKADAWKIGKPCHQCGFDPAAPEWKPPTSGQRSSLDELLQFAHH